MSMKENKEKKAEAVDNPKESIDKLNSSFKALEESLLVFGKELSEHLKEHSIEAEFSFISLDVEKRVVLHIGIKRCSLNVLSNALTSYYPFYEINLRGSNHSDETLILSIPLFYPSVSNILKEQPESGQQVNEEVSGVDADGEGKGVDGFNQELHELQSADEMYILESDDVEESESPASSLKEDTSPEHFRGFHR